MHVILSIRFAYKSLVVYLPASCKTICHFVVQNDPFENGNPCYHYFFLVSYQFTQNNLFKESTNLGMFNQTIVHTPANSFLIETQDKRKHCVTPCPCRQESF